MTIKSGAVRTSDDLEPPVMMTRRRAVDVPAACGELIDTMDELDVRVVSIEGRWISPWSDHEVFYVCASLKHRSHAHAFLIALIGLSLDRPSLRDSIVAAGHPKIATVGSKVLVWWPELCGRASTIH